MPRLTLQQYLNQESYDPNGNLIERSDNSSSNEWDYNNRLLRVKTATNLITYAYDPSGMRISGDFDGAATTTYPTAFYNTDGNKKTEHIFVNGVPAATVEKIGTGNPTIFWNSQDHLRSTSVVTDANAQIAESVEYYAFGSIKSNTGSHKEQRKYTGHEFDILSKYTYAQSRYLDTKIGRFLSEDPAFLLIGDPAFSDRYSRTLEQFLADPQLLNSYSYARNNPLKYTDPDGENLQDILNQIQTQLLQISQTIALLSLYVGFGGVNTAQAPANAADIQATAPYSVQQFVGEEIAGRGLFFVLTGGRSRGSKLPLDEAGRLFRAGDEIGGFRLTEHAIGRMQSRNIASHELESAIRDPLRVTPLRFDELGRPSQKYIGEKVTAVVNPIDNTIPTLWQTSQRDVSRILRELFSWRLR